MGQPRILLVASTTGYQTRAFEEAASRLDVRLQYATNRCDVLDNPWCDAAIPIRFRRLEESVNAIVASAARLPVDAVLAVGDAPALLAACAAERLGLPFHFVDGAAASHNKLMARERLRAAGLPAPAFRTVTRASGLEAVADLGFPCVVKPVGLSGSRGVIRANDRAAAVAAVDRVRLLLESLPSERDELLIEEFIPGREFAVEGVMTRGALHVLAIFDKPDPLDGPFFEETIYVTPSAASSGEQAAMTETIAAAARALGLWHGPVHAECRVNNRGVFVLEIAARPIGGLCARALRFIRPQRSNTDSLEALLLAHALGGQLGGWVRETAASGVMMIPVPGPGVFKRVTGVDAARAVTGVTDVRITAKLDQVLVPLPEGASYLGFIFASASEATGVDAALRTAHSRLGFTVDPQLRMVQSRHG